MRIHFIIIVILGFSLSSFGGVNNFGLDTLPKKKNQSIPISLEKVLELADANNQTIELFKAKQDLLLADLDEAKAWWIPDVYAGAQYHWLNGTAMNTDGRFFQDLNRRNLWTGLGLDVQWDFKNLYAAKEINFSMQAAEAKTKVEKNKILLESVVTYIDLMQAQTSFLAYQELVEKATVIANQIQLQVDNGLKYESESLMAQNNVQSLEISSMNYLYLFEASQAKLINLLNLDPTSKLVSVDSILGPIDMNLDIETINFETAYTNRPEFQLMELNLQGLEYGRKTATKGLLLPEFRLQTDGGIFGGTFDPLDPTTKLNAGLLWKIPLEELFVKSKIKKYDARIKINAIETNLIKNSIDEEINRARGQSKIAASQMELAERSVSLAQRVLDQSIARYQNGTVETLEIYRAQENFIKSKLQYLEAVGNFNKSQFKLHIAMGN